MTEGARLEAFSGTAPNMLDRKAILPVPITSAGNELSAAIRRVIENLHLQLVLRPAQRADRIDEAFSDVFLVE